MSPPELTRKLKLPGIENGRTFGVILIVSALFGAWCGTQYVAYRLGFDSQLGEPLFTLSDSISIPLRAAASLGAGLAVATLARPDTRSMAPALGLLAIILVSAANFPTYGPLRAVEWGMRLGWTPPVADVFRNAGMAALSGTLAAMICLLRVIRMEKVVVASASHGSARWGDGAGLVRAGGMELGRRLSDGKRLYFDGEGHHICLSPTGGGKGVSSVIPNLLHHRGSAFVVDVKPELYAVTARRRRELGQRVICVDPFDAVGGTDGCNPMDWIDVSGPDALDDADLIADMCFAISERTKGDEYWNEEGLALLMGLILHVKSFAPPELQHLP